jgi:hypothetical protein
MVAGRHGVVPAPTPGITAQDAPYPEPYAFYHTVGFHGLNKIGGTARGETAPAVGAAEYMQRSADKALVEKHR